MYVTPGMEGTEGDWDEGYPQGGSFTWWCAEMIFSYRQTCYKPHLKIIDHSDVVGASPVGAAPTTSLFYWLDIWLQDETRNILSFGIWCDLY